ncbi:MAG: ABC transporter permease, partial [Lachnospiraceae bacterium]|nr:ABC transporter permease [Lachnospiraceae bacterium]
TIITVLSLSLSVILLNITFASSKSFDLHKYLSNSKEVVSDFIIADARYFQPSTSFTSEWNVPDDAIAALWEQGSITDGGRTYGCDSIVQEFISEEDYRISHNYYSESAVQKQLDELERENGKVPNNVQLYGMEPFCLNKMHVIEGDLTKLMENPDGRYIAAAAKSDDYGNLLENSYRANPGDTVNIRYIDEVEIYNTQTGEIYSDVESIPNSDLSNVDVRVLSYRDIEYEVAVLVVIPSSLNYRYSGPNFSYILDAETFMKDTGTNAVMYYTFDTEENTAEAMEEYIGDLTGTAMPQLDYQSKKTYADAFYSFTRMFLICGSALSFIVGLVGILNFLNAVLTSIMTRQREFALLQSVGMSGRQLKTMLITEGILLSLSAVIVSLIAAIATIPLVASALGNTFPFFVYHFTLLPLIVVTPAFILLGILLPIITHRFTLSKSIVERLREA